ncbi:MAG: metallophosphoesterase family protein [Candidatus Eisenbacteria bacterium]|uniref:Metallophosphoesterase family protein n=1 Tax=Eiseniibacteriota bacterium TaxID=2212470 RepID=A0A948RV18_UNCEI|nr:metallophosphoesterase family protein [Candidatus Eisenbacteria bacterium]MBU1948579.1 metallophosphoesterase family protein [Candidatus Eisenbacteria bacterium]MBU2691535.1 metallophosphoesterase family protein [Candidatus Eisenbacteria bacterium]
MTHQEFSLTRTGRPAWGFICLILLLVGTLYGRCVGREDLPIDLSALEQIPEVRVSSIHNLFSREQLAMAVQGGETGLIIDFSHVRLLLDETSIDPAKIYGYVHAGPYPFEGGETKFSYKRFRISTSLIDGRCLLPVGQFLLTYNSEDWITRGQIVIRFQLFLQTEEKDRFLGLYDIFAAFHQTAEGFAVEPWLLEGPCVNLIESGHPDEILVSFVTNSPVEAAVLLSDGRRFTSNRASDHNVKLTRLKPDTKYQYQVRIGDQWTKFYSFKTAAPRGAYPVVFALCGDSRSGHGGGSRNFMGVNYMTLEKLASLAYQKNAAFFLMDGDLITGYTTSPDDFRMQLYGFKQAMSGFWCERPVYTAMGNHEALLKTYESGGPYPHSIDRWPYDKYSAEAVFAESFHNPKNGPDPSDPRRPTYKESVYSFQYGAAFFVVFNNNYWYGDEPELYGGSPEGYLFDDQMKWIERELEQAEIDPSIQYVFLMAQEPVFPCGGHVNDAMWYDGSNNIRAYVYSHGRLEPEKDGLLEVRNRFARLVAQHRKVAAVFCSDEHSYYRVIIDNVVPVGDPLQDDRNEDGVIAWESDEPASPLKDLGHPVWYLTCGGGGAPYYSEQPTPWNQYWKSREDGKSGYYYSSQENIFIVAAYQNQVSLEVYNPYGELIDSIPNLMTIKNR